MDIPAHYDPSVRPYQLDVLNGLRNSRFSVLVIHRRAGKTLGTFAYAIKRMTEEVMNVVMVFPTQKQGFDNFWTNTENDGFKTINHIPKQLIARQSNSEDSMFIELKNGSVFRVLGATKPEALRGANAKIYIFDEFVDIPAGSLNVVRPIVLGNKGQIIIQSTPKLTGVSGETFKRLYESAKKDPKQYAIYLPADKSGIFNEEQLEEIRQDIIAQNGNDFMYRQEMLLDWGQADATAYYAQEITKMEKDGRIGIHEYNPKYPVYTSMDMGGGADATAVCWWQVYNKSVHIIDFYETEVLHDESLVKFITSKPYVYAWHFIPHDGAKRDSDAISRIQKLRRMGLGNASLLRRIGVEDGIKLTAELLHKDSTTIHQPTTTQLVSRLKLYSRKYNELTGDYLGPEHKTESHAADSLRYCATALDQKFNRDTLECYLEVPSDKPKPVEYVPNDDPVSSFFGGSPNDWDW